jgi:enoyl-CoA hydratase/carnithine racemase
MPIRTDIRDHVLLVTLDRPEAMNALDPAMSDALEQVWRDYEANDGLRVAVLTGAGAKAFSAGADLKTLLPAFRERIRRGDAGAQWNFGGGLARGIEFTKPLIAAVNGHALAGGLEMALACDIRLCSSNATFSLAEAKWAVVPGAGGTQRLPRAIPMGMAMEMLFTGASIDAATAYHFGLVNRVLAPEALLPDALALAGRIAAAGPLAVRAIKRSVKDGLAHGTAIGMQREHEAFVRVIESEDAGEGYRAFAEKRAPVYRGR